MIKFRKISLLLLISFFALIGCAGDDSLSPPALTENGRGDIKPASVVQVTDLHFLHKSVIIYLAQTETETETETESVTPAKYQVQLAVTPDTDQVRQAINYESNMGGVVSIDDTGQAQAISVGTAVIKASITNPDKTIIEDTMRITVLDEPETGITLEIAQTAETLSVGGSTPLTVTVTPPAVRGALLWSSTNEAAATVSEIGGVFRVRAHAAGTATITAKLLDGSGTVIKQDSVFITVELSGDNTLTIEESAIIMVQGTTRTLNFQTNPAEAAASIIWASANNAIASVSAGQITAKIPGNTVITARLHGGSDAVNVNVTVIPVPVEPGDNGTGGVNITDPNFAMAIGESPRQINFVVEPGILSDAVIWASTNPAILTVSETGVVTPVSKGSAAVTATIMDASDYVIITVLSAPVTSLGIVETELFITTDQNYQLSIAATPVEAAQVLNWTSTNIGIVEVNSTGRVTGKIAGTSIITASYGGLSDTVIVHVLPYTPTGTGLNITDADFTLTTTASPRQLTWTTTPVGNHASVVFSSSNTGVAAVTSTGLVTPVGVGTASITGTLGNQYTDSVTVTVENTPAPAPTATGTIKLVNNSYNYIQYVEIRYGNSTGAIYLSETVSLSYNGNNKFYYNVPAGTYWMKVTKGDAASSSYTVTFTLDGGTTKILTLYSNAVSTWFTAN